MNKEIDKLSLKVIKLLDLDYEQEISIMIGNSNMEHMKRKHFEDYKKYVKDINMY